MKHILSQIDWWLVGPVIILIILGLTTLASIDQALLRSQVLSALLGMCFFIIFSKVDIMLGKTIFIQIYVVSLIVLGIVLLLGIESHGAIRWLSIFGVRFQFSEILKPFLIVTLAAFLTQQFRSKSWKFLFSLILLIPVLLLIFLQPDLGNAIIYATVTFLILLTAGFSYLWFVLLLVPIGIVSPLLWHSLHEYQRQRLLTFFHPSNDPSGTSYNVIQAMIAVGSGKFTGKGFNEATQSGLRFLPERHTDFIFATISEELGFVGAMLIIVCFFLLSYRVIMIYRKNQDPYKKIIIAGSLCLILTQFFINVGMNIGLLPVVGVTLPFVSFGGSSLLSNCILLGLIASTRASTDENYVLEIR